jgi:hypothetical protein
MLAHSFCQQFAVESRSAVVASLPLSARSKDAAARTARARSRSGSFDDEEEPVLGGGGGGGGGLDVGAKMKPPLDDDDDEPELGPVLMFVGGGRTLEPPL